MVVMFLLLVLGCRSHFLLSLSLFLCSAEPLQPCHPVLGHRFLSAPLPPFPLKTLQARRLFS
ncbi:hypothetical protein SOVF_139320 isoform A [Spinacia oleracea]|nr:hypothetical protein SOVF_139320 isoform A [Spinacia oleracea]